MRARRRDRQALPGSQSGNHAAQPHNFTARFVGRAAHVRAHLHNRLHHLRLELLLQDQPAFFQDLRHIRAQLTGMRIDDLIFLFDANVNGKSLLSGS